MSKRQYAIVTPQGQCEILEDDIPSPGQGEVLVQLKASMISPGTQLGGVREARAGQPSFTQPRRMGYQGSGVITELGEGVTQFKVGQRVACLGVGAGHATYGVLAQNLCVAMPDNVSFEEASCMNLTLTAMHCFRRAEAALGEFMLIVGLGVVGQMTGQIARAGGQYVMGWDMLAGRREIARQYSVDDVMDPRADDAKERCAKFTDGLGFDTAVMAISGNGNAAFQQIRSVMKVTPDGYNMGTLVMVGGMEVTTGWAGHIGNLDLRSAAFSGPGYHDHDWERGISTYPNVFVRWTAQRNMQLALRMISDGRLNTKQLISHKLPLSEFGKAVDLLLDEPDKTQAVVLMMND